MNINLGYITHASREIFDSFSQIDPSTCYKNGYYSTDEIRTAQACNLSHEPTRQNGHGCSAELIFASPNLLRLSLFGLFTAVDLLKDENKRNNLKSTFQENKNKVLEIIPLIKLQN